MFAAAGALGSRAMCGRFAVGKISWAEYRRWLELTRGAAPASNLPPRYNVAPTDSAPVAYQAEDGRRIDEMRFGLVPEWWDKPVREMKFSTINARSETVQDSRLFQRAFRSRRALIPVIGFYEWTGEKGNRQPWFITTKPIARVLKGEAEEAEPPFFCLAGIWERANVDGDDRLTFSILTGPPNDLVGKLHNRMPAIIAAEDWEAWLDPACEDPKALIAAHPAGDMDCWPVERAVGNPRSEGEMLILPAEPPRR